MTTAGMQTQIEGRMVTTGFELPGYRIEHSLGMARGIVVRSRSIVGSLGAWLQTFVGGNISLYTSLAERARRDAYERMLRRFSVDPSPATLGANARANRATS